MKRLTVILGALALALALSALAVGTAGAQGGGAEPPTQLRAVDATDSANPMIHIVHGSEPSATVVQNGQPVPVSQPIRLADAGVELRSVIVVDTGANMNTINAITSARDGLTQYIAGLQEGEEVAVISAGDTALTLATFSSSTGRLSDAVGRVGPAEQGGSALWQGVATAVKLLNDESAGQGNVIVITDNQDVFDANKREGAIGSIASSGAALWVVAVDGGGLDDFSRDVSRTGGAALAAAPPEVSGQVASIGEWLRTDQWVIPFESTVLGEDLLYVREEGADPVVVGSQSILAEATLELPDAELIAFAYHTERMTEGIGRLGEFSPGKEAAISIPILSGDTGRIVGVVLAAAAAGLFVFSMATIFGPDEGALSNVLRAYSEDYQQGGEDDDDHDDETSALSRTALIQRAVSLTESVADSQGMLTRTESALERADLPLRAAEALFVYVAAVAVTAIALLIFLPPIAALILMVVVAVLPAMFVSVKASIRRKRFETGLPDMLQLLSGTLRAGYSLMQGVEAVSQEVSEPMGKELRRVVTESRLGRPLEESMDGVAERMASPDFAWAVMAIRIQREVGGNLSELLLTVSETMVQRERLRRDVQALTAEGRMSAMVLGLLPIGLGFAMYVLNPEYTSKLLDNTLGNIMLGGGIVMMGIGFAWMSSIIKIDI